MSVCDNKYIITKNNNPSENLRGIYYWNYHLIQVSHLLNFFVVEEAKYLEVGAS